MCLSEIESSLETGSEDSSFSHFAVKTLLVVITSSKSNLVSPSYQPLNLYPFFVGAAGVSAVFPFSIV